jgi:hypothetical protein
MNLVLKRYPPEPDGIFGVLYDGEGVEICETLEHSFDGKAIIPPGLYTCVRGIHQLEHGEPFETFEIVGVSRHSGLLFHVGNRNEDSHGCILVGDAMVNHKGTPDSISGSRDAFARLMSTQAGREFFQLTVQE